ncbi:MAG TPA: hypothetical protein VLZ74_01960 [Methylocella sp.]|nr:hypothetical protein [Methylocella sp.]
MTLRNRGSTVKAKTIKSQTDLARWLFMFCTLLLLASVIRMWSHWLEISATLGFYPAAVALSAVTGAALIVSWWVNTDSD